MMTSEAHRLDAETQANEWIKFGMKLGVCTAVHPFEYAKVLIQIGFEPIAPRPGTTLFGSRTLILPNVFQYIGHIRSVDGVSGCFRGIMPKLVGNVVSSMVSERVAIKCGLLPIPQEDPTKDEIISDEVAYQRFEHQLKRELVISATGIIVCQPFTVVSYRMMAYFVGREDAYKTVWSTIKEIWSTEGIFGFFSGIVPKMIFDLTVLALATTTAYCINKHMVREREGRQYTGMCTSYVYSSVLYPLQLVSACMIVSGANMRAGQPPQMPIYANWRSAWRDLSMQGELKRGSSLFFRYVRPMQLSKVSVPFPQLTRSA